LVVVMRPVSGTWTVKTTQHSWGLPSS
jgi:hypothetical protein